MMKKLLIVGAFFAGSVFAASQDPLPTGRLPFGNDGYISAETAARQGPIMKFCPPGHYFGDIDGGDGKGCGPIGKGSTFLGRHDNKNVVDSITAQEFVDKKFGAGKVEVVGVAPGQNSSSTPNKYTVIFYRIKK